MWNGKCNSKNFGVPKSRACVHCRILEDKVPEEYFLSSIGRQADELRGNQQIPLQPDTRTAKELGRTLLSQPQSVKRLGNANPSGLAWMEKFIRLMAYP